MLASLGEAIRTYRLRQRQPHNGQPWTQEDLAVVIGTDKAHVNRIERNRQRPELKTLLAICEALRVSLYERCYLLGLAGYGLHLPRVGPDEERSVLAAAAPLIESCSYPLLIVDDCLRLLDMTELHARVFGPIYGGAAAPAWSGCVVGPRSSGCSPPTAWPRCARCTRTPSGCCCGTWRNSGRRTSTAPTTPT
jgi:transcriptional regulator with XRE-family HTH domain